MILIGPELEQALATIQCCCDFPVNWSVLDQIQHDSRENQVDPKQYILHDSKRIRLTANVDEYEPETIALHLDRGRCDQFDAITSAASERGFGIHGYFLDRPRKPPRFLADAITAAHQASISKRPLLRMSLVACDRLNSISRCFVGGSRIKPTPYWIYAVNVRTMSAQKLSGDDAKPYTIKGYR